MLWAISAELRKTLRPMKYTKCSPTLKRIDGHADRGGWAQDQLRRFAHFDIADTWAQRLNSHARK